MKRKNPGLCLVLWLLFSSLSLAQTSIKQALQPYVDRNEMPGFVSVLATKDKILQVDCIGYANVETKQPIRSDQVLWIASTTKIFTACAVMSLVDEGKIQLDDPVEKYLPEFKNLKVKIPQKDGTDLLKKPDKKITIRMILCHVAGWTFQTSFMNQFGLDSLPLQRLAFHIANTPLVFEPGSKYKYSENGIDTAGAIVEVVSGIPYEDYLQKKFFDPLGMKDTTFWPSKEVQKNRWIHSHKVEDGKLKIVEKSLIRPPFEDRNHRFPEPGAGLFSTPDDLTKFFQMLAGMGMSQGQRYLSEKSVIEITTKQTPDHLPDQYGLCSVTSSEWFGHGGAHHNQCHFTRDGLVRLLIVQVVKCPKSGESYNVWVKEAQKFFDNYKK